MHQTLFFGTTNLVKGWILGHCPTQLDIGALPNAGVAYVRRALRPSSRRASPGKLEFSSGVLALGYPLVRYSADCGTVWGSEQRGGGSSGSLPAF